jgi:hypothetical protein
MALRILTINVQMIIAVEAPIEIGPVLTAEAIGRANAVSDAILAMPDLDLPHVVAFNEVFNEEARDVLMNRLKGRFPHQIRKLAVEPGLAGGGLDVQQDSGLALVSRIPLLPMPDIVFGRTTDVNFIVFEATDGIDGWANKGAGIVLVEAPFGQIYIVFTHMQATADAPDAGDIADARNTRKVQLEEIVSRLCVPTFNEPNPRNWDRPVVIVGDININGYTSSDPTPDAEYQDIFLSGFEAKGFAPLDAWSTFIPAADRGVTRSENSGLARYDYAVFRKYGEEPEIVTQHMRVIMKGISDHAGLWMSLNRNAKFATPTNPRLYKDLVPTPVGTIREIRWFGKTQERFRSYSWIRCDEPGTYSWFGDRDGDTEITCFLARDFSTPWPIFTTKTVPVEPSAVAELRLDTKGHQLVIREAPWYLRLRSAKDDRQGLLSVGIIQHRGTASTDAIALLPNEEPLDPGVPSGQPMNSEDRVWFQSYLAAVPSGVGYDAVFEVQNNTGDKLTLEVFRDPAQPPVKSVSGSQPLLSITLASVGGEFVFPTVIRARNDQTNFRLLMQSPICFLQPELNLQCLDETGIDEFLFIDPGDEIRLKMYADGVDTIIHEEYWENVDTGDPHAFTLKQGFAFVEKIDVKIREEDIAVDDRGSITIRKLGAGKTRESQSIACDVGDGEYRLDFTLANIPPGGGDVPPTP